MRAQSSPKNRAALARARAVLAADFGDDPVAEGGGGGGRVGGGGANGEKPTTPLREPDTTGILAG